MEGSRGPWIAGLVVVVLIAVALSVHAVPTARTSQPSDVHGLPVTPLVLAGVPEGWTRVAGSLPDRGYIQMVYDSNARLFILHGGSSATGHDLNETWSYDSPSNMWSNLTAGGSPPSRSGFGMVYDSRADLVILFGGRDASGTFYSDTWTFNVSSDRWTPLFPANEPPARASFGMAYDSAADRVIVFGGNGPGEFGDTWAFDLTNDTWTQKGPTTAPSPRHAPMMAYEPYVGRTVLFGGEPSGSPGGVNDTWSFNYAADTWTNVTSGPAPHARLAGSLIFDSNNTVGRMILFGGANSSAYLNDTWAFNAATAQWAEVSGTVAPPGLTDAGMAYGSSQGRPLLFAGVPDPGPSASFWSFDYGSRDWTNLGTPVTAPSRAFEPMIYDARAGASLLFGGLTEVPGGTAVTNEVWTFNLTTGAWTNRTPIFGPTPRANASLVYDSAADRILMFGGNPWLPVTFFNDTWSLNLATDTWTNVTTAGPLPRAAAAMVYDASADRIVLFGGHGSSGDRNDTWTYDVGTRTWTNVTPTTSPSPRTGAAMAYDPLATRTVLYGGYGPAGYLNDTWAFDVPTKTWTQRALAQQTFARGFGGLAYDAAHDHLILFGGFGNYGPMTWTWEYNYTSDGWSYLFPLIEPSARGSFGMDYDAANARTIVAGGFNGSGVLADVWAYGYPVLPSAPQGLSAVAGTSQVTLSWSPPASNGGSALGSYVEYRGTSSGAESAIGSTPSNPLSYVDAQVTPGTTYYYEVAATTIAGEGPRSAEAHVTTPGTPPGSLPSIFIETPVPNENLSTVGTTMVLKMYGVASSSVGLARVELSADGSAWVLASGTSFWTGNVTIGLGVHVITARATDTAGNQNATHITVTVTESPGPLLPVPLSVVLGVVFLAAAVIALVVFTRQRRRSRESQPPPQGPEPPQPPQQ